MGKRIPPPDSQGPIEPVSLKDALEERYLAYALSTITAGIFWLCARNQRSMI